MKPLTTLCNKEEAFVRSTRVRNALGHAVLFESTVEHRPPSHTATKDHPEPPAIIVVSSVAHGHPQLQEGFLR
ncbi:unnamed protein product, partial [Iphiclides podalirius]